jgi:hypothetical protein
MVAVVALACCVARVLMAGSIVESDSMGTKEEGA